MQLLLMVKEKVLDPPLTPALLRKRPGKFACSSKHKPHTSRSNFSSLRIPSLFFLHASSLHTKMHFLFELASLQLRRQIPPGIQIFLLLFFSPGISSQKQMRFAISFPLNLRRQIAAGIHNFSEVVRPVMLLPVLGHGHVQRVHVHSEALAQQDCLRMNRPAQSLLVRS